MKQINIFELQNTINKKKARRTNVYDNILLKCHMKIEEAAKKENYFCYYDVPEYVIGLPLYNITDCIEHVIDKLKENGFKVHYLFPKMIHISWYPNSESQISQNQLLTSQSHQDPSKETLFLNYVPYVNKKGKFVLNVD